VQLNWKSHLLWYFSLRCSPCAPFLSSAFIYAFVLHNIMEMSHVHTPIACRFFCDCNSVQSIKLCISKHSQSGETFAIQSLLYRWEIYGIQGHFCSSRKNTDRKKEHVSYHRKDVNCVDCWCSKKYSASKCALSSAVHMYGEFWRWVLYFHCQYCVQRKLSRWVTGVWFLPLLLMCKLISYSVSVKNDVATMCK